MSRPRVLHIVDGHALVYRAYYAFIARPLRNAQGENTSAIFGFTRMLLAFLRRFAPEYLLVVFDSGKPTLRHDLYGDYKANRRPMPEDLRPQIPAIQEIVSALGLRRMEMEGYEADDVVATVTRRAVRDGFEVRIVSRDKDLAQLIGEHVRMLMPGTGKGDADFLEVGPAETAEHFLVPPERVVDLLALMGDASDNIPGVRGVGEKTALKLLERFGSLEGIYGRLAEVTPESLRRKLEEGRESAFLSRRLATLEGDLEFEPDWESFRPAAPDRERLAALFERYNLRSLAQELSLPEPSVAASPDTLPKAEGEWRLVETAADLRDLADRLATAEVIACDIETDGLDPFRDPVLGIAFSWEEGKGAFVALRRTEEGHGVPTEEALAILRPILESPGVPKVGQNFKFDSLFLAVQLGIDVKPVVFDTMLASFLHDPERTHNLEDLAVRHLGVAKALTFDALTRDGRRRRRMSDVDLEDLARYSAEDADLTLRLYKVLSRTLREEGLLGLHERIDLPMSRILAAMERTGVRVDAERLRRLSEEFGAEMAELERRIHEAAGVVFNVNSTKQLQEVLFGRLGLRQVKRTKTALSTDNEVLEELAVEHPVPRLLLEYRSLAKLKNTYTDRLPEMVHPVTGRIHTSYNMTAAVTGRLSSSNPNLQNIPVKDATGRRIREAFVPEPGWVMVSADYSQIELRVLAHLSEDATLVASFRNGEDIHERTAREVLGVPPDRDVTPEERRMAKVINFGVIYGMGPYNLSRQLGISIPTARNHIERYLGRYPGIRRYYETVRHSLETKGCVENLFGRRRTFAGYKEMNKRDQEAVFRMAINTPVQGTAADLIKLAMIRIAGALETRRLRSRMILQVHDEIVLEAPPEEVDEVSALVRDAMENAAEFRVPLTVDLRTGSNWAEAH